MMFIYLSPCHFLHKSERSRDPYLFFAQYLSQSLSRLFEAYWAKLAHDYFVQPA